MDHLDADEPEVRDQDPWVQIEPINPDRLAFEAEQRRMKQLLIIKRRRIRDIADPFDVTYQTFVKSYRLSHDVVFRPHVIRRSSALTLPLEKKVPRSCLVQGDDTWSSRVLYLQNVFELCHRYWLCSASLLRRRTKPRQGSALRLA